MKFSIITVSYQAGDKLLQTVKNIVRQTESDYEIIIKDGMSTDGSVEALRDDEEIQNKIEQGIIRILREKDRNVYDGMNQAIQISRGEYLLFLNCGDFFYREDVLSRVASHIRSSKEQKMIYYGNTFCRQSGSIVHSAPKITGFTCYRNIPCHQSCFYDRRLFSEKEYDTQLKIRADYDHFLWCYYEAAAGFQYLDLIIADYEGGGISENKKNRKIDQKEHALVVKRYMPWRKICLYRMILLLTLAPVRRKLAESKTFAGIYNTIKDILYKK